MKSVGVDNGEFYRLTANIIDSRSTVNRALDPLLKSPLTGLELLGDSWAASAYTTDTAVVED